MGALKLCKEVSKPGLLQAVRAVVDPVAGRKFAIGTCLMSGLAVFLEKHASLLQLDVSMREDMENRLKEQQLDRFADRASCHRMPFLGWRELYLFTEQPSHFITPAFDTS